MPRCFLLGVVFFSFLFFPVLLLAHHPMGEAMPSTAWQGLLSGFAHPFLDAPYGLLFAFIALLAFAQHRQAYLFLLPLALNVGIFIGLMLTLILPITLSLASLIIITCLCLCLAAAMLLHAQMTQGEQHRTTTLIITTILGISHGMQHAAEWIGAETTPIVAYAFGILLLHYAICQAIIIVIQKSTYVQSMTTAAKAQAAQTTATIAIMALSVLIAVTI